MSVKSVQRAANLLGLFSRKDSWLGISRIAKELDMSKSAAHGLASTLVQTKMLRQDPVTKRYCLGLRLFELSMIQPDIVDIHQKAAGPARFLSRATGFTCHLALWGEMSVQLVHSSTFPGATPMVFGLLGPRLSPHASALGKAILAALEPMELETVLQSTEFIAHTPKTITDPKELKKQLVQARKQGFAMDNQELVVTGASLAAPFFDSKGRVVGAVSLFSTSDQLLNTEKYEEYCRLVMESAFEISSLYGASPDQMSLISRS